MSRSKYFQLEAAGWQHNRSSLKKRGSGHNPHTGSFKNDLPLCMRHIHCKNPKTSPNQACITSCPYLTHCPLFFSPPPQPLQYLAFSPIPGGSCQPSSCFPLPPPSQASSVPDTRNLSWSLSCCWRGRVVFQTGGLGWS